MAVLPKRFARFGLSIHPTKTTLIAFRKPDARQASANGNGTFDFLGLTHYWTKSRRGCWVIKRKTARKRLRRTKKSLWRWCRTNRHAPLKDQYQMLCLKLRGHFQYYGIRGNFRLLEEVLRYAEKAWRYWLSRRSSKSAIGWEKFQKLLQTISCRYPRSSTTSDRVLQGSTVMRQSGAETLVTEEPYELIAHVRICGGAGWATAGSTRKPTRKQPRAAQLRSFGCKAPSEGNRTQPGFSVFMPARRPQVVLHVARRPT